ncbi:zinc/cadmium/mercury/lead-transporting ATPase [Pantoea sp. 1.19]|uniref:zinc/cadmium/mercury/lead-transporting ATPase n=1 Tax=Pantoea sp. 1.19 TaxID=1925589 RepID=UPI0009F947CB|nr:zinc/cadmium/mercury/lead-transporting ATPase [Pantoea sp. 1.19]
MSWFSSCGVQSAAAHTDRRAIQPQIQRLLPLTTASSAVLLPPRGSHRPTADPGDTAAFSRRYGVRGMDCAGCARRIEQAVEPLPGVHRAQVLFASQKLCISADRDVTEEVSRAVSAAGFDLIAGGSSPPASPAGAGRRWRFLLLIALLVAISSLLKLTDPAYSKLAFTITTTIALMPVLRASWQAIRHGNPFAIDTLMSVAALGALAIGATDEAAVVLLLFLLGERLEGFAAARARQGITALMALKPEHAVRLRAGRRETVAVAALRPGDLIEISAGDRLPADARLRDEPASFDESALTGESLPVDRQPGERLAAGSLCLDRRVTLDVLSEPGDSAIDRILQLIEEAEATRAPIARLIDRFSRLYTPAIMLLALAVALLPPLLTAADWQPWIYKALTLLLIGCPCALVISTPAAIACGLAAAARHGALIKGGAALEDLARIRTLAFDKTGTLTAGSPQVIQLTRWCSAMPEETLLAQASALEQGSHHPLAQAIVRYAGDRGVAPATARGVRTVAGRGISGEIAGEQIRLSAPSALAVGSLSAAQRQDIVRAEASGSTVIVQCAAERPLALYALRDTLRPEAREVLVALRKQGLHSVMLTGDHPRAAAAIASELGIDYRAGLLPADKVAAITALNQQAPVAMVGDGINDAPAMKAARIGIAMGSGSDVALESADAALTRNHLGSLVSLLRLARGTRAVIGQNVAIALGLKTLFLVTTLTGFTGLWLAVLADSGATVLVTANALRLLRQR